LKAANSSRRYSFIGCRPRKIFICGPQFTEIPCWADRRKKSRRPPIPLSLIEQEMRNYKPDRVPGLPRFKRAERRLCRLRIRHAHRAERSGRGRRMSSARRCLFHVIRLAADLRSREADAAVVRECAHPSGGEAPRPTMRRVAELQHLFGLLNNLAARSAPLVETGQSWTVRWEISRKPRFERAVKKAKNSSAAGDIIQFVPSQRFTRDFTKTPLDSIARCAR